MFNRISNEVKKSRWNMHPTGLTRFSTLNNCGYYDISNETDLSKKYERQTTLFWFFVNLSVCNWASDSWYSSL